MFEGLSLLIAVLIAVLVVFCMLLSLFAALVRFLHMPKTLPYFFGVVLGGIAVIGISLLWATRIAAIPGVYRASGVWGYSTLTLRVDHTATQEVQFMEYDQPSVPPYRQHPTQHKIVQGHWEERGRDWFDRKLVISSLVSLGPPDEGRTQANFECSYGPVMLSGLGIEVDAGADIVYRK